MTIWLVRHAHAGNRTTWRGDDDERPLSQRGLDQARAVAERLDGLPVTAVLSSPSTRCAETVAPVAVASGVEVRRCPELAEGTDGRAALALLLRTAADGGDVVACSHGDVIPSVLRLLTANGMRAAAPDVVEKGSIWELEVVDGEIRRGAYLGVPTVDVG